VLVALPLKEPAPAITEAALDLTTPPQPSCWTTSPSLTGAWGGPPTHCP